MLTYAGLSVIRTLEIRTHGYSEHFWADYGPLFPLGNPDHDRITEGKLRQIGTETGGVGEVVRASQFFNSSAVKKRSLEYRGSCSHFAIILK
jgi:hypothetical protein